MKKPLRVYKFGGSSVKDAEAIRNVASIIRSNNDTPLVVVVSAMGKTTNALEEVVAAHSEQTGKAFELLEASGRTYWPV